MSAISIESISNRLSSVQDTVEVSSHLLDQYCNIAIDILLDNDLADLAAANVAMTRAHAIILAQQEHIKKLENCVSDINVARRELKGA